MIVVAALIAIVTLVWVALLMYTNLPTMVLGAIALVSLVLLSVATAWAAIAAPNRSSHSERQ